MSITTKSIKSVCAHILNHASVWLKRVASCFGLLIVHSWQMVSSRRNESFHHRNLAEQQISLGPLGRMSAWPQINNKTNHLCWITAPTSWSFQTADARRFVTYPSTPATFVSLPDSLFIRLFPSFLEGFLWLRFLICHFQPLKTLIWRKTNKLQDFWVYLLRVERLWSVCYVEMKLERKQLTFHLEMTSPRLMIVTYNDHFQRVTKSLTSNICLISSQNFSPEKHLI